MKADPSGPALWQTCIPSAITAPDRSARSLRARRPAAPPSPPDAASQLGLRPVQLAQAIRKGRVATVCGRGGELLVAHEEVERVRREGVGA